VVVTAAASGYLCPPIDQEHHVTVVFAIRCSDGLVLAADSQITQSDRGMSFPAQKLHPFGEHAGWGGSGARSVLLDVEHEFDASAETMLESEDIGREMQQRVLPILRHHYEHFIDEVPGEPPGGGPSAYVLAAGYSRGEQFIVEINPHAMVSHYEDIGFHAIGSGAPMAQQAGALLAHFRMIDRSVDHGVVAAVRVLDALAQTSPSVGGPLDIFRITPEGTTHLEGEEIEEVREQVTRWTDREQELLDHLFD
jgi:proteasome beta subunit